MNQPVKNAINHLVRATRGGALTCKGWQQEAAMRMLMNTLDPEVAEHPNELAVCCGSGRSVHAWDDFSTIGDALRELGDNETLIVQSGRSADVFRTHSDAPRVAIVDSRANHPAATWTYVGTQGVLPTTYEVFSAAARRNFGGTLAGRLVAAGGMGGMGGAQPLAATLNGAAFLGIDADPERIKRRVRGGYCEIMVNTLDEALRILKNAVRKREPASIGLIGNCAEVVPELARRGIVPDLLTDQTPADDPNGGYLPMGITPDHARELQRSDPSGYRERALDSVAAHARGMLELQKLGSIVFEYGNGIGAVARSRGVHDAISIPEYDKEYLEPLRAEGRAPLLCVALSGEAADIARMDRLALELFSGDERVRHWVQLASRIPRFQGLPARICWLDSAGHEQLGVAINDLVARGELKNPVVIASGAAIGGELATPGREERGFVSTDAGQRPSTREVSGDIANLTGISTMIEGHSGASWVAFELEANGHFRHTALAAVADGSADSRVRLERILITTGRTRT